MYGYHFSQDVSIFFFISELLYTQIFYTHSLIEVKY